MSWLYDPFKPMSKKTAADWATDYMIYKEVTKDWDSGSGGGNTSPSPSSGGGKGCGCLLLVAILLVLAGGVSMCMDRSNPHSRRYWAKTTIAGPTASTTHSYPTQSAYRSTTYSYRYTTEKYTTRDDPFDAHGYLDADDFAGENYEEFDDYDEAYDYYEDYMAGYD